MQSGLRRLLVDEQLAPECRRSPSPPARGVWHHTEIVGNAGFVRLSNCATECETAKNYWSASMAYVKRHKNLQTTVASQIPWP